MQGKPLCHFDGLYCPLPHFLMWERRRCHYTFLTDHCFWNVSSLRNGYFCLKDSSQKVQSLNNFFHNFRPGYCRPNCQNLQGFPSVRELQKESLRLQQVAPQPNRKLPLPNIYVSSATLGPTFVPQFDMQPTVLLKIYIPGGPVHNIGHICNIGQHIKDTDLFSCYNSIWAGHW